MEESLAPFMIARDSGARLPNWQVGSRPAKAIISLLLLFLAFGLAGCMDVRVEAQVTIDVEPNGSGTFSAAMGMSRGLRDMLEGRDGDPMLVFTRSLSREGEVISLRKWDDGELEWVEGSVPFAGLKELNEQMDGNELISDFSLTKQKSLLKDRFVLDAVINPVIEDTEDSLIDPSRFLDFQVIVRLPGELVETNGFYDLSSQGVAWTINGKEQQTLHAVSEMKSWTNLSILLWLSSAAVSLFLMGVGIVAVVWSKRRRPEGERARQA